MWFSHWKTLFCHTRKSLCSNITLVNFTEKKKKKTSLVWILSEGWLLEKEKTIFLKIYHKRIVYDFIFIYIEKYMNPYSDVDN